MLATAFVGLLTLSGFALPALAEERDGARVTIRRGRAVHVHRLPNHRTAMRLRNAVLAEVGWSCTGLYRGFLVLISCTRGEQRFNHSVLCARRAPQTAQVPRTDVRINARCHDVLNFDSRRF